MHTTSMESVQQKESRRLLQNYSATRWWWSRPAVLRVRPGRKAVFGHDRRHRVNALGHGHPRIAAAMAEQAARCLHTSNLVYHPYQGELAERLRR